MTDTARRQPLADLDRAQQHLSWLLLAERRDPQAICKAADQVARLERAALAAER